MTRWIKRKRPAGTSGPIGPMLPRRFDRTPWHLYVEYPLELAHAIDYALRNLLKKRFKLVNEGGSGAWLGGSGTRDIDFYLGSKRSAESAARHVKTLLRKLGAKKFEVVVSRSEHG